MLPTIIWRHKKENLKKCSLKNLENRKDLAFFTYPQHNLPNLDKYVLLTLGAPLLTEEDKDKGLLFIDATWKYAGIMEKAVPPQVERRTLPADFKTAYPRKQTLCLDPSRGLATVEAIFTAYLITARNPIGLLDHYYFKDEFLKKNAITQTI